MALDKDSHSLSLVELDEKIDNIIFIYYSTVAQRLKTGVNK